jgi:hypothetical protein
MEQHARIKITSPTCASSARKPSNVVKWLHSSAIQRRELPGNNAVHRFSRRVSSAVNALHHKRSGVSSV